MSYYVYVLRSEEKGGKFYIGMTTDVQRRLLEHNQGKSKFTSGYIPWKVVCVEELDNRKAAREREKYFKSAAGRRFFKNILENRK